MVYTQWVSKLWHEKPVHVPMAIDHDQEALVAGGMLTRGVGKAALVKQMVVVVAAPGV